LRNYLGQIAPQPKSVAALAGTMDAEHAAWSKAGPAKKIAAAPNGIPFPPDYRNWRTVSRTDRFDNATLRGVLGNEVAIKAIADRQINPWPDGTVFAKVAWTQAIDEDGTEHAGPFYQVEFMIRDSRKYASTLGWGFARWRGADLKPYGQSRDF